MKEVIIWEVMIFKIFEMPGGWPGIFFDGYIIMNYLFV